MSNLLKLPFFSLMLPLLLLTTFIPNVQALNSTALNGFVNCLKATGVSYHLTTGMGGSVIVLPSERRRFGRTGSMDDAARRCISIYYRYLPILWHSSESTESDDLMETASSLDGIDDVWMGDVANSLVLSANPINGPTKRFNRFRSRDGTYFTAFPSDSGECSSSDLQTCYDEQCYSYASSYSAIQFFNDDDEEELGWDIWPHHDCQQGDDTGGMVAPRQYSQCVIRTTYSWDGIHDSTEPAVAQPATSQQA